MLSVAADLEIAQKQNELKSAGQPRYEADIAQAGADAAKGLRQKFSREQERVAAEADREAREEAEVKEREVKVREQELMLTSANRLRLKNTLANKRQKHN